MQIRFKIPSKTPLYNLHKTLARAERPEEISRLTNRIHECLEKMNQGSPYPLTVSIGVAKAAKGLKLENLLKEADAKLYQEKRR